MAEEGANFEIETSSDEEYYVGADFDENEAIMNGVMMGLDWESIREMMYNGFGHLLAEGYPSPEAYQEHMMQKEKMVLIPNTQRPQNPPSMKQTQINTFNPSNAQFPPLGSSIQMPFNPLFQYPPQKFNNVRGRGGPQQPYGRRQRSSRKPKRVQSPLPKKKIDHMNLANEDCRFYLAGSCSKGLECTYRHRAEAKNTSSICESWQAFTKCEHPQKCKFLHPTKQPEAKICHFFARGLCKNGSSCKFLHTEVATIDPPEQQKTENGQPEN